VIRADARRSLVILQQSTAVDPPCNVGPTPPLFAPSPHSLFRRFIFVRRRLRLISVIRRSISVVRRFIGPVSCFVSPLRSLVGPLSSLVCSVRSFVCRISWCVCSASCFITLRRRRIFPMTSFISRLRKPHEARGHTIARSSVPQKAARQT